MIRLHVLKEITQNMVLSEHRHYIVNVYRLREGDCLRLFNARSGEFVYQIEKIDRQYVYCMRQKPLNTIESQPRVSLALSLIKPSRLEWIIEKATEIGVREIFLVDTMRTVQRKPDMERLNKIVINAVQQSKRLYVPKIVERKNLTELMAHTENLIVCDRLGKASGDLKNPKDTFYTLLIGPEGGFDDNERHTVERCEKLSLMHNGVLRSETAALLGLYEMSVLAGVS